MSELSAASPTGGTIMGGSPPPPPIATFRMIVRLQAQEGEILEIGRIIKDAIGDAEIFTYEEKAFLAFWKSTPPMLVRKVSPTFRSEHQGPRVNGPRKYHG